MATRYVHRGNRSPSWIIPGAIALSAVLFSNALATWSIVVIDRHSGEIVIGAATCVQGIDLERDLPVLLVDRAAACAQAFVDVTAENRLLIHEKFLAGIRPTKVIESLAAADASHQSRQYGLVDRRHTPVSFSGSGNFDYAGGVTGESGDVVYAIQGNILTGSAVIEAAESALLNSSGQLPDRVLEAMEAARSRGGDGRCSCGPKTPTTCGSPPPSFETSAHVAFLVGSRSGDRDGECSMATGCASGDYFLNLNVPNQTALDPDAVVQLQQAFVEWRTAQQGRPDAVATYRQLSPIKVLAEEGAGAVLTLQIKDYFGDTVSTGAIQVQHAADSAALAKIGGLFPVENGGGVKLTGTDRAGLDRFDVVIDDGVRPVVLIPKPELLWLARSDIEEDGDVDRTDLGLLADCLSGPLANEPPALPCADLNRDQRTDLLDFALFQTEYTQAKCVELEIDEAPRPVVFRCDRPFSLRVTMFADPAPRYQWLLDGEPIPGATGGTYSVSAAGNEHTGLYSVRVANTCGELTTPPVMAQPFFGECP